MHSEQSSTRILVVDDERMIADSLALILRGRGFACRTAYSGEDAAELALTWKPHVVVTDVVMGVMSGIDLAIYLSQSLPSCKVLLISGNHATEKILKESRILGHDFPILAKPFHPDRVFEFLAGAGNGDSIALD